MSQKVVFITGAGSGMGQLAAKQALRAGDSVAAIDINMAGLDSLGKSDKLIKIAVDVTDPEAVRQAVLKAEAELGPITRLINAAGIMPLGRLLDQDQNLIHKIMAINYGGLVNVTRAVLPGMLARKHGEFISFSSIAGHAPTIYMGAYNASKFAVSAFTEVLYHENRNQGVTFVCVCPPAVATPLLKQAKDSVWPKMFDEAPAITPVLVLQKMEKAVKRGEFWVFPGILAAVFYRLRRFAPGLVWWRVHQVEGV